LLYFAATPEIRNGWNLGAVQRDFEGVSLVQEHSSERFSVSVVIPAFNVEDLISRALDSILVQTVRPSEIIVVDDGSTDGTAHQVERYGDKVRYIHQENSGPSVARNTGIRAATSDWVAFLDADDLWHPDKLVADSRVADAAPGLSWIISNHFLCEFGGDHQYARFNPEINDKRLEGGQTHTSFLETLTWGLGWDPLGIVVKKNVVQEVGGFRAGLNYGEDLDLCLKIARLHPTVGIQPRPVAVHYIDRPEGLCLRRSIPDQMATLREIYDEHEGFASQAGALDHLRKTFRIIVQDSLASLLQEGRRIDSVRVAARFRDLLPLSYVAAFAGLSCLPKNHRNRLYTDIQWRIRDYVEPLE
jgi:GT2 family glycosyltransferase